ncbi:hypothetical protein C8R44DRAFT_869402 [Mycena epipterygia]|nr:hypothetical protein C8R44DRAFT_869402 [Mycena epipterygia]
MSTAVCTPALSRPTTTRSPHIHIATQRRLNRPVNMPTTMLSNQRGMGGRGGHNAPYNRVNTALAAGPCAPSQISRPPAVPPFWTPPVPGLRWEKSPYTCVPLLDVDNAPQNHRQCAGVPCLAPMAVAQPHPPSRIRRPIALPPQIHGIASITLNPALAKSNTLSSVDFASPYFAESNAAWWHRLSSEPATYPALPSLTIVSPQLPWAITAHVSGRTLRCLTVSDVLDAICDALRLQVDEEGFRDWIMTQSGSRSPRRKLKGGSSGMTRLDLLGKTTFAGLVASGMGCDIWVLEVV